MGGGHFILGKGVDALNRRWEIVNWVMESECRISFEIYRLFLFLKILSWVIML